MYLGTISYSWNNFLNNCNNRKKSKPVNFWEIQNKGLKLGKFSLVSKEKGLKYQLVINRLSTCSKTVQGVSLNLAAQNHHPFWGTPFAHFSEHWTSPKFELLYILQGRSSCSPFTVKIVSHFTLKNSLFGELTERFSICKQASATLQNHGQDVKSNPRTVFSYETNTRKLVFIAYFEHQNMRARTKKSKS